MWIQELRAEIEHRLDCGADLDDVQAELVDTARGLSEDERAAVWLFAWSYQASGGHDRDRAPAGMAT